MSDKTKIEWTERVPAMTVETTRKTRIKQPEPDYLVQIIDGIAVTFTGEDFLNLHEGLRDLLAYWDRLAGPASPPKQPNREGGWTAADVKRLAEIRKLVRL